MKRIALILATAVAGLVSLCAGVLTYGYLVFNDMPVRAYRSQGPNAAWVAHSWVNAIQSPETYGRFAAMLHRNRITDIYFYMGRPEADGTIPAQRYPAAPILLRALQTQQPSLRLHAWIGEVERRGGGIVDLSDAAVRRNLAGAAERFLALGFNGIHYGFPAAGSGNSHLLMLLDQTRILTRNANALLSITADALEPAPGLAWLTRETGSWNGYWTGDYYAKIAARVDQIAVAPAVSPLPFEWVTAALAAWQTRATRPITAGHATLFVGVPAHAATMDATAGPVSAALLGIRKGMTTLRDDPFADFGVAVDLDWPVDSEGDRALLANWLDVGDLVAR
jgi:hypothetical protein